jgi:hypothetical protein
VTTRCAHRQLALAALVLWAASAALYARAVGFDFVDFDDATVLLAHPNLYDESSLTASLGEIFVGYFPREEPLLVRDVSWALDARLFGFENPAGYHLGNVLLNATNVALLFLFLSHATGRKRFAFGVAGIFALLPVHVEPVCWVMGRKDLLAALWLLLGLLAQSHELSARDPQRRRTLYLLSILCILLAVLSKMSAVVGFLLLAAHRVFHRHLAGRCAPDAPALSCAALRGVALRTAPHAAIALACFVWFQRIVAQYGVIGWRGPGPLEPQHLATVARFAPLLLGRYVANLAWPSELSMFYRWPSVEIPLTGLELLGSAALTLAFVGTTLYACLRRRDLAFYPLAVAILLIPYLNIVYIDIWLADRYIYLTSFCLLAIPAHLFGRLWARSGSPMRLALGALLLAFAIGSGVQTLRQQSVWRDSESLWQHEANLSEPSLLAIQSLAKLHVRRAEHEADPALRRLAIRQAHHEIARGFARERALSRQPSAYATSEQLNLARLHTLEGRLAALEGAPRQVQLAHYEAAEALAPNRDSALRLAGTLYDLAVDAPAAQREALVRRSFAYFIEYMGYTRSDPLMREKNLRLLAQNYESRFPFLKDEIRVARRTTLP